MAEKAGPTGAINRANFLNKLCFVRFGLGLGDRQDQLRVELIAHLESLSDRPISKQSIINWFDRSSAPARSTAFVFLQSYIDGRIEYSSLDDARKQVFAQIGRYVKKSSPVGERERVHLSVNGSIVIETDGHFDRLPLLSAAMEGVYECYKMRFSEERSKPIAREILRIYRKQRELRFEQWFLRQGGSIDKFDGVVVSLNNLIWLIGSARSEPDRLRITCFRKMEELDSNAEQYRWGIAVSEIPYSASKEPSAARVVMLPIQSPLEIAKFAQEHVAHLAIDGVESSVRSVVARLIDNHLSAFSTPGSIEPAVGGDGLPIRDLVLKVDQRTMDAAISVLTNLQDDSESSAAL